MTTTGPRRSLYARLVDRHLDFIRWPTARKTLMACSVGFPFHAVVAVAYLVRNWLGAAESSLALRTIYEFHLGGMVVLGGVGLASFVATRKRWEDTWTAYLLVLLYGALLAYFIHRLGTVTHSLLVAFPIVVLFISLFFKPAIGWMAFAYGIALTALITILELSGFVSYAPAAIPRDLDSLMTPAYYGLSVVSALGFFIYVFFLSQLVTSIRILQQEKIESAYAELQQTKDQLVRAESLAAVGSLVTGAAHELRNPLASSGGLFQSLREELANSSTLSSGEKDDAVKTIDMALRGQKRAALIAERLYQLTDDLVTHKSSAPLGESVATLAERYPGLRTSVPETLCAQRVSQALVDTVLPNLLDNAVAAGSAEPPALEITRQDGKLEIVVADSGRGIPRAQHEEVFKPFFTGQKTGEGHGVGLGLYIVHELVTRMGGSVALASEEGRGTRVTVKVPLMGFTENGR